MNRAIIVMIVVGTGLCSTGCGHSPASPPVTPTVQAPAKQRSLSERFGTHYSANSVIEQHAPRLRHIPLPDVPHGNAIWGATGRDDSGNLYFGVSCGGDLPSAHLLKKAANEEEITVVGDIVSQLQANKVYRPGESQMKIHSKICQANDGALYFASMDEKGEKENGSQFPTWGGHLWRWKPGASGWEHLLTTREALIAAECTGRYVYALGYFGHVLYQFDTETDQHRTITVGSVDGHISRNFLVDGNEHVYVPRVTAVDESNKGEPNVKQNKDKYLKSTLVEYNSSLEELQETPLPDYDPNHNADTHGIVGYARLQNGEIVFTTHTGAFWKIEPSAEGPARVTRLGWFHPDGKSYTANLCCPTGERFICGLAKPAKGKHEWTVYDLENQTSKTFELDAESQELLQRKGILIYGSNTLDNQGAGYLVGWINAKTPHLMKFSWEQSSAVAP